MSIVAAEGAGDDWGEVVDLHEASLRRVIGSRTQHADEVDDILQETYLRALRAGRHPLRAELSDEGWLRMLARRASVDAYRNHRRRLVPVDHLSLVADPATADGTASPGSDEHLDAMASREAVRWAFQRLSPRQQRLLVLRGVDQLTYQQMAAMEQTTVEALASALNRARERLRANIGLYRRNEARRIPAAALFGLDLVRRLRDRFARAQALVSPHIFELAGATMAIGMAAVLSAPVEPASAHVHAAAVEAGTLPMHVAAVAAGAEPAPEALRSASVAAKSPGTTAAPGTSGGTPRLIAARPELTLTSDESWMRLTVDTAAADRRVEVGVHWRCTGSTVGGPACDALDLLPGTERGPRP